MKIAGSKIVITGGNRGIGKAVAAMAANAGAHVIIASRKGDIDLETELKNRGAASVTFWPSDLSTREGVEALAKNLRDNEVDILFNNAGLLTGGLLEEQPLDEIYEMFQVNLLALVHLSRAVLPGMIQRRRGKIINHASVSAFMHFPCASTYAASKAAVVAFTNCLESEVAGTGVSTLCLVTPGIKTRMFDQIEAKYSKNFETPKDTITPEAYAEQIRAAIEDERRYLWPRGFTAVGLWLSRYTTPVFNSMIKSRFKR